MNNKNLFKDRLNELAERSYNENRFCYTDFCGQDEISEFWEIQQNLSYSGILLFGGYDNASRCMIRFGNPKMLGYDESFPIDVIQIKPVNSKFSDELNHRDFLGALMNLGIKREVLGDICVEDNMAYLFCKKDIREYIIDNLNQVKHTTVRCEAVSGDKFDYVPKTKGILISVLNIRVDAVISKVYNISRSRSSELFLNSFIYVNGRQVKDGSAGLKENDCVSVRGYGKFVLVNVLNINKKGKTNLKISIFD